jgi:PIN domain nuclease of toxin-antitoxin system
MRLLLDTHTFLWYASDDPSLSRGAKAFIEDVGNERLLSVASPWEVAVKVGTGKMKLVKPVRQFFTEQLSRTRTQLLPITLDHVDVVATLPRHHGDPFDRLIISQAIVENVAIVSVDSEFDAYPIVRRW